ncbi:hypothetical protein CK203_103989 [Vitis vinifera]|uniref:Uncharacterized protein n=1 Tax=Vitis vinifera TaxID=29760 RepID=A0A438CZ80_VITVI|nr:hypothetical protein CK203_103989 [Vitis vinifera]
MTNGFCPGLLLNFGLARRRTSIVHGLVMGISRTEVNLRRLLAAAPQQQNQAKLIHYVATLREQLEQLTEERTLEGLPRVSKPKVNEYSEKIEAIASKITAPSSNVQVSQEPFSGTSGKEGTSKTEEEDHMPLSPGLRKRFVPASKFEDRSHDTIKADASGPVKLDAAAQAHIEKHRYFFNIQDQLFLCNCYMEESKCESARILILKSSRN